MLRKATVFILLIAFILVSVDVGLRFAGEEVQVAMQEDPSSLFVPTSYWAIQPNVSTEVSTTLGSSFTIETNAYGMRMPEVKVEKTPGVTRVAVLGNSVAFGWGLPAEHSFPYQLQQILDQGSQKFEVLNFAAPNFTSLHALRQYEELVQRFNPDILVLALGLHDVLESRISEKDYYNLIQENQSLMQDNSLFSLLDPYSATFHHLNTSRKLQAQEQFQQELRKLQQNKDWAPRVSPQDFEQFLKTIVQKHQAKKGKAILVHTNFLNPSLVSVLSQLSEELSVPLLNVQSFFASLGGVEERRLIPQLKLKATRYEPLNTPASTKILFRVYVPVDSHLRTPIFIVGDHPQFGDGKPNAVQLYDDRSHGDERGGDNVWSLEVTLNPAKSFSYAFTEAGPEGEWGTPKTAQENLAKNRTAFYRFELPDMEPPFQYASPIHIFGKQPYAHLLQPGEIPLPNELGHKAIAQRLAFLVRDLSLESSSLARK